MKLYVLTSDQWDAGYGSEISLYGVFDSMEQAQHTAEREKLKSPKITETYLNDSVDEYLGGYIE